MDGQESRKKVSYYRQPEDMTIDQWQAELGKQFASTQQFQITILGTHPVYSDFRASLSIINQGNYR